MRASFDVVVVGARCAGAPLATLLARNGLDVCLLDKDEFPSDTLSTHGIQPTGVQVLERLGVLDRLLELSPPVTRLRIIFDDAATATDILPLTGGPGLSARRIVLDEVLVDAARAAGADVRTRTMVTGVVTEGDRVVGVRTADGELRARLVVGADGTRSTVAKHVGAQEYCPTANGRIFMWAYYEGDPTGGEMWIGKLGDHTYLAMPTDGGLSLVAVCPSIDRRDEVRAERERVYTAGLRAWPEMDAAVDGAGRVGALRTMANLDGFFRPAAGKGWALVGDAGHFKDPTPGQGIGDALRQAEKLASMIPDALARGDDVLRDWWRWRDEDAWEMYWFAHDMGAAGVTPPVRSEVQRRTAGDPAMTEALIRVLNHELRPAQAFPPAFAMRAARRALRRGPRRPVLREMGETATNELRRARAARRHKIS